MADYTFFFNPMSRAQIARWALHEVGADYDPVFVPMDNKPPALMNANPMGKLPTIIHHMKDGDHVVTEAAAICHYLADAEASALLPNDAEKADYFRWLFFAAGPVETAVSAKAMDFDTGDDLKKRMTVGWGSYDQVIDTLDQHFTTHDFVCGSRFTMADVYVGSQIDWGLQFSSMPDRASFLAYADRLRSREAYDAAKAIDMKLIGEMQQG